MTTILKASSLIHWPTRHPTLRTKRKGRGLCRLLLKKLEWWECHVKIKFHEELDNWITFIKSGSCSCWKNKNKSHNEQQMLPKTRWVPVFPPSLHVLLSSLQLNVFYSVRTIIRFLLVSACMHLHLFASASVIWRNVSLSSWACPCLFPLSWLWPWTRGRLDWAVQTWSQYGVGSWQCYPIFRQSSGWEFHFQRFFFIFLEQFVKNIL